MISYSNVRTILRQVVGKIKGVSQEVGGSSWRFRRLQVNRPFGFIPSKKPRTLSKFNIYADEFKSSHFGKPAQMISTAEVESEFWRLLDDENTDVVVEYGADLSARDHGSGFPTTFAKLNGVGKFYVNSPWNLNNVAVSERSALRFLPKDISGMIVSLHSIFSPSFDFPSY
ncbi:Lysine-specific demethylase 5B [Fasciola hepatica]|uniref:Lysine-specific demethylase 5B n=1 Tax=Fasciola hepatica TaxID=6192 RepID=A0A4E0QZL9_FASHE|nr:Lysine-specific demethylase 5B [Fasciola hepatica]